MTDNNAIVLLSKADLALEKATEILDILDLRDKMAAIHKLFSATRGSKETANRAKLFQLKAERKAGSWLQENVNHTGGGDRAAQSQEVTALGDLPDGITKNESSHWQLEASLDEEKFNAWVDEGLKNGWEFSSAGLRVYAKNVIKAAAGEEGHPVGEEEGHNDLAFAMILNAIDERDAKWLLSKKCEAFHEMLGLSPDAGALEWAQAGCPSIQEMIKGRYKQMYARAKRGEE